MMKILHMNAEMELRGGELQTVLLARKLQEKGHSCIIFCQPGSGIERESLRNGLRTETAPMRSDVDFVSAFTLSEIAKQNSLDIIHSHNPRALGISLLGKLMGCRINHVHTRRVDFPLRSKLFSRLKYSLCPDMVIAVSVSVRDQLIVSGINREKISVIPGGIDKTRFHAGKNSSLIRKELKVPDNALVIGSVSHFSQHKGHRFLIDAMAQVLNSCNNAFLVLAGEGRLEKDLKQQALCLGISDNVIFTGFRADIENLLPGFDIFVLPSIEGEGSPSALKEALVSGIPVIASDIAPVREIITGNINGLLVKPGDSSSIAEAVKTLISNNELRLRIINNGYEISSSSFDSEEMANKVESVYFNILEKRLYK